MNKKVVLTKDKLDEFCKAVGRFLEQPLTQETLDLIRREASEALGVPVRVSHSGNAVSMDPDEGPLLDQGYDDFA